MIVDTSTRESDVALAARGLTDTIEAFEDDMDRKPTSDELCAVLTLALQSVPEDTLSDVRPSHIIALRPQLRKDVSGHTGDIAVDAGTSAVADLNDNTFVVATGFLVDVAREIARDTGHPPTLDAVCRVVVEGLHRAADNALSDVTPRAIVGIKAEIRKALKIRVKIGDIVAIPARTGGYFMAVVLAKNPFGTAYGLFDGTTPVPKPPTLASHPPVRPHPIYSDDERIADGRWRIVGHHADLATLFPAEPEIYHRPKPERPDHKLRPYGVGETAAGRIRPLQEGEAKEIGLLDGTYRQGYLSENLEALLNRRLP